MQSNKIIKRALLSRLANRYSNLIKRYYDLFYFATLIIVWPFIRLRYLKVSFQPKAVLHIGNPVHVVYNATRRLRAAGIKADFLAIGKATVWNEADHYYIPPYHPVKRAISDAVLFWNLLVRYEILHVHNAIAFTHNGWGAREWKNRNRFLVVHWRGCDLRDYSTNIRLHPDLNICTLCDYDRICETQKHENVRRQALKYGDAHIVTTPDMKDFLPNAVHSLFPLPDDNLIQAKERTVDKIGQAGIDRPLVIVHVTNHQGIEGTASIMEVVSVLQEEGYLIDFRFFGGQSFRDVLKAYDDADVSIGKMKMGYYANAQIESMLASIPAITYIRPEYMSQDLENSGIINSSLTGLKQTLIYIIENPEFLMKKKKIARRRIQEIHNLETVTAPIIRIYRQLEIK